MPPDFLVILLSILYLSSPICCTPVPKETGPDAEPRHRSGKSANAITMRTQKLRGSEARRRHLNNFNGSLKRKIFNNDSLSVLGISTKPMFLVILPGRKKNRESVSIFDMERKQFLCFGLHRKLFRSKKMGKGKWCTFHGLRPDFKNSLRDSSIDVRRPGNHSEPQPGLREGLQTRRRRSHYRQVQVNPSDPLRSENHRPGKPFKDRPHKGSDREPQGQEQTGAVSKETITSFDDPLHVLHSKVPVSPIKTNIADMTY